VTMAAGLPGRPGTVMAGRVSRRRPAPERRRRDSEPGWDGEFQMRCGTPAGMTITAWAGTAASRAAISAVRSPSVTTTRRSLSRLAGGPGSSGPVRCTAVTRPVRALVGSSVSIHRVSWPVVSVAEPELLLTYGAVAASWTSSADRSTSCTVPDGAVSFCLMFQLSWLETAVSESTAVGLPWRFLMRQRGGAPLVG
jgi:hypothetical protein